MNRWREHIGISTLIGWFPQIVTFLKLWILLYVTPGTIWKHRFNSCFKQRMKYFTLIFSNWFTCSPIRSLGQGQLSNHVCDGVRGYSRLGCGLWRDSGCSSVIEYSRNLIWPRSIFFILSVWCWFSYGVLINSNNVWIWGIIQISKIFARLWQFSFLFYMK